jgi:hypothetical protein
MVRICQLAPPRLRFLLRSAFGDVHLFMPVSAERRNESEKQTAKLGEPSVLWEEEDSPLGAQFRRGLKEPANLHHSGRDG